MPVDLPFETAFTMASSTKPFNKEHLKLYTHEEAQECGFISKLATAHGICSAQPNFPGVALYATNRLAPPHHQDKCVRALVQIIPADEAIVYSEMTTVREKEAMINMVCTTKDTSNPVRFLLGNFFPENILFTISDGKNMMVELILGSKSYTKLAGTITGKEVLLADTGLKTASSAGRPASGTCYKITIVRQIEDPKAFLRTFDNSFSLPLMALKTPIGQYPAVKKRDSFGQPSVGARTDPMLMTDGEGDEVADNCAGPLRDCPRRAAEISSCASIVSSGYVESRTYARRPFKPVSSYSVNVYLGKSLPLPEPKSVFVPQLILCGGRKIFICPHGSHGLSEDIVSVVENMDCACTDDDAKKYACIKVLANMLN